MSAFLPHQHGISHPSELPLDEDTSQHISYGLAETDLNHSQTETVVSLFGLDVD